MKTWQLLLPLVFVWFSAGCRSNARGPELRQIALVETSGWTHDVALGEGEIYLSDRQGGFAVLDRGDFSRPPHVAAPVSDVISLARVPNGFLLASRFEGLVLASRSGQVLARYVADIADGDIANAVENRGDLAFVAYGLHGLVVVRLTTSGLRLLSQLATPGWSHHLKLRGNRAFLADWDYGLRVVDIADPESPVEIAVLPTPATTITLDLHEQDGVLMAAVAEGHAGVAIACIDRQGHPWLVGRNRLGLDPTAVPHPEAGGWVHGVSWSGSCVFVANWKRGLAVLDVSDVRNPKLILEQPTTGTALGVAAEQQRDGSCLVYLADGEAGLRVFRFTK